MQHVAYRKTRDEWMKEMHEKPKLSMLKLIAECEVKSSCSLLKSKGDRKRMLKLRGVTVHLFPDGDWKMALGEEGVEGVSRSATVGRLRMCAISCCSALHEIISDLDWPTAVPEMKSAEIPVLVLARKYFRKIKRGDLRVCRPTEGLQTFSAVI